jgi:hypothetical protein
MTPQEKAKHIFEAMYNNMTPNFGRYTIAKRQALVCVDEMLEDRVEMDGMRVINDPYWMEVKNEIEKI